ncbi:hypothetical protein HanHA300_Chr01g0020491 [Helianthus annuus]|nr:hypothetical protein HanHA300_Chr01g0020491 [Helianthus annuus]KAJ0783516.1 hypothetical protein HanLR1_Chr01g0021241 [Helianthus annuus]
MIRTDQDVYEEVVVEGGEPEKLEEARGGYLPDPRRMPFVLSCVWDLS